MTSRGMEYRFTNGSLTTDFTELHCHCTLYEYNRDNSRESNRDFRWIGRIGQRVQACLIFSHS